MTHDDRSQQGQHCRACIHALQCGSAALPCAALPAIFASLHASHKTPEYTPGRFSYCSSKVLEPPPSAFNTYSADCSNRWTNRALKYCPCFVCDKANQSILVGGERFHRSTALHATLAGSHAAALRDAAPSTVPMCLCMALLSPIADMHAAIQSIDIFPQA